MEAKKQNHKELDDLQAKVLSSYFLHHIYSVTLNHCLHTAGGCTAGIHDG